MASDAGICNLAYSHFGHNANIVSIEPPDDSVEANLAAQFYPLVRDELLESHAWTFATKRIELSAIESTREDFAYAYAMPADCLKARKLMSDGYASDSESEVFEVEDGVLYTDSPPTSTLIYTYKLRNTGVFSPLFVSALAIRLASYLVGPVQKDTTGRVQTLLMRRADVLLAQARTSDANVGTKRSTKASTAARVR